MKKKFTLSFSAMFVAALISQSVSAQVTTLQGIKALYSAPGIVLPSATLTGVVISDSSTLSTSKGNSIVQAGGTGIIFRYAKYTPYTTGDSVSIDVTGDSLVMYNGALEIIRKASTFPAPVASGVPIAPLVTTLADITANLDSLGYTLVQINNAKVAPGVSGGSYGTTAGTTFSGSKTMTDASGSMMLYTPSKSSFAKTAMPTVAGNWTGYVANYNGTPEFTLRNLNDFVTLPLVFKSFSAVAKGTSSVLSWSTGSEVNTSKFVIEKSTDGLVFNTYNTVVAKGLSSNDYSFTDATNKVNSTVYYRLKSLDKDGKFIYSNIIVVKFASAVKLTLAPNPTISTTKLTYDALATDAIAQVISSTGATVKQVTLKAGSTETSINVSSLAKGTYFLAITKNGSTSTVSFVKQ